MRRTRHPWPPADDALMRTEYGRTPTRELAARIGVTPVAVNQRAKKLGLDAGRSVWTPDRIAQLRGLYAAVEDNFAQPAPSISPAALRHVIQWLRNGCDPMKAADELEILIAAAPEAKP